MINSITRELNENGIVVVPGLLTPAQLQRIQVSFEARLKRMRWNNVDGYEKTERYRHMVQDVLMLEQGFVDLALHPTVKTTLHEYLGASFELVEAKGWKSLPTERDFHGWHYDAWYDQQQIKDWVPREVKLGVFLTEVKSGGFVYCKGTHGQQHSQELARNCTQQLTDSRLVEVTGAAGLAFLFDTSGIHRQNVPIVEPRQAVFYCYHDPEVPLQNEDLEYYRYHPLHLNAAFLGNLTEDDRRILGFGNAKNFQLGFERSSEHPGFQALLMSSYDAKILYSDYHQRIKGKLKRISRASS